MFERFVIERMDPRSSTIFLTKAEPSSVEDEEEPLDIGSWLTLYQRDGPPRTAILCFEPKPKMAREIKKGDVILDNGSPCRVLDPPASADADGEILIEVHDIFADEATDFITDDKEEITMVATWQTRYYVRNVSPAGVVPSTLVLQKQEGRIEDNPERVFELPGGRLGPSLLPFFNMAEQRHMPITLLIYEVMGVDQSRNLLTRLQSHTLKSRHSALLDMDEQDKGKQTMDLDKSKEENKEEDQEEEDKEDEDTEFEEEEEEEEPLEIGGFLTPVMHRPTTDSPTETPARDLSAGQAILIDDRPYVIVGRSDTRAQSGPLASRHQITLEITDLFDIAKKKLRSLTVKATEKLKLLNFARVRYTVLGLIGPDLEDISLQKQHRDPEKRTLADFHVGKMGDGLGAFFAQCEDDDGEGWIPITLLILEAVGRFQVIGFGIGDWDSLG